MANYMRFPVDINAPNLPSRDNNRERPKKWYELLFNPVSLVLAAIGVLYSIYSFQVSREAYNEAKRQFDENNISSEKQFQKLTALLETYQKISQNTLHNSELQLQNTKDLIFQTQNLGQPIISVEKVDWKRTDNPSKFSYQSLVSILIKNKGFRPLKILDGELFVVNQADGVIASQKLLAFPEVVTDNVAVLLFPSKANFSQKNHSSFRGCLKLYETSIC